ncbi:hypothetical protein [Desulfurobacterium sp.]|uniref:hypothetical protein n=1 Tax=Desulfurobacterium sp. TaxID=2004706 RepID=UPI002624E6FD|nr:hypothetical protein [Desulfurobacterium sp.]
MVEVKNGLIYRDGKVITVNDLLSLSEKEIGDKELANAVKRAKETGKSLVVVDAGERKKVSKKYVIINGTGDTLRSIKKKEVFVMDIKEHILKTFLDYKYQFHTIIKR